MDGRIVAEKLESLRRCLQRVEQRRQATAQELAGDPDAQDVVALNLTRAVQTCVDIATHVLTDLDVPAPQTMGEGFDRLYEAGWIDAELAAAMKAAVGFRNIAVHNYRAMDWDIVHRIAHQHLDEFRRFAARVAERLP